MESIFIWAVTAAAVVLIFLPFFYKARKQQKKDAESQKESIRLGADVPVSQHPQIDEFRCIGCGACIKACPEGEVLGIINGKAAIINGSKCIGHGLCAPACPVEGITIGLGDMQKRSDIPLLSSSGETSIPGIYIVGELSGIALIKNAIEQGKQVINELVYSGFSPDGNGTYDVLVVGAGPAGISAALAAKQHKLSYLLIDQNDIGGTILKYPRKKLVMTQPVELPLYGWLDKTDYSKEFLVDIWNEIRTKQALNFEPRTQFTGLTTQDNYICVHTTKKDITTRKVVLALGRRGTPRKLKVAGEDKAKVMYSLLDTSTYNGHHILIVGGGDSAVEAAMGLALQRDNRVTLSYRKERFFRIKKRNEERLTKLVRLKKIEVLYNSEIVEIYDEAVRLTVADKGEIKLVNDYVFVFAGGLPPFKLLKSIGIRFGGETSSL